MVVREGEQHDVLQLASDFLEYYHIHSRGGVESVAGAVDQRYGVDFLRLGARTALCADSHASCHVAQLQTWCRCSSNPSELELAEVQAVRCVCGVLLACFIFPSWLMYVLCCVVLCLAGK